MAALSQDKIVKTREVGPVTRQRIAIATASKIYRGSLVNQMTTTGRAVAASAATNRRFAGLAVSFEGATGTGTGVTGGTEYVIVEHGQLALVNIRTAIRTNAALHRTVNISDDNTVGGTGVGTSTLQVRVGELLEFEASNKSTGWVKLRIFADTTIAI
jgi:hypothetical protein